MLKACFHKKLHESDLQEILESLPNLDNQLIIDLMEVRFHVLTLFFIKFFVT
jgi:hypothetical protein